MNFCIREKFCDIAHGSMSCSCTVTIITELSDQVVFFLTGKVGVEWCCPNTRWPVTARAELNGAVFCRFKV